MKGAEEDYLELEKELDSFNEKVEAIRKAKAEMNRQRDCLNNLDGSTSNADWWIRDFYDTAGGRQRDRASGTGGSNASAGMVHIK